MKVEVCSIAKGGEPSADLDEDKERETAWGEIAELVEGGYTRGVRTIGKRTTMFVYSVWQLLAHIIEPDVKRQCSI